MDKSLTYYAIIKDNEEFDKWFAIRPIPEFHRYSDMALPEGLISFILLGPNASWGSFYYGRMLPLVTLAKLLRHKELCHGDLIGYVSPVKILIHEFSKQCPDYQLCVPVVPTKECNPYVIPQSLINKEKQAMKQDNSQHGYWTAITDEDKFTQTYVDWYLGNPINLTDAGVIFLRMTHSSPANLLRGLPALKVVDIAEAFFKESKGPGSVCSFFNEMFSAHYPGRSIIFRGKGETSFEPEIVDAESMKIYDATTGKYTTLSEHGKFVPSVHVAPNIVGSAKRLIAFRALVALKMKFPGVFKVTGNLPFTYPDGTIDLYSLTQRAYGKDEQQKVSLSELKVFLDANAGKTPRPASELTDEQKQESIDLAVSILLRNMIPMHQLLDNETAPNDNPSVRYVCSESGNVVSSRPYFIDFAPMFEFVKGIYGEQPTDDLPKDANGNVPDIQKPTGPMLRRQSILDRYSHASQVLSKALPGGLAELLRVYDDLKSETRAAMAKVQEPSEPNLQLHVPGESAARMFMYGDPAKKLIGVTGGVSINHPITGFESVIYGDKKLEALARIENQLERIFEAVVKADPNKATVVSMKDLDVKRPAKEEPVPETVPDMPLPVYADRADQNPATLLVVGYHFKGGKTYHIENNWEFPRDEVDGIEFCNCEPVCGFETPAAMARYLNQLNAEAKTGWVFKPASELLSGLARELLVDPDAFKSGSKCFLMKRSVEAFNETFGYNPDNRANNVGAVDMAVVVFGDALNDSLK